MDWGSWGTHAGASSVWCTELRLQAEVVPGSVCRGCPGRSTGAQVVASGGNPKTLHPGRSAEAEVGARQGAVWHCGWNHGMQGLGVSGWRHIADTLWVVGSLSGHLLCAGGALASPLEPEWYRLAVFHDALCLCHLGRDASSCSEHWPELLSRWRRNGNSDALQPFQTKESSSSTLPTPAPMILQLLGLISLVSLLYQDFLFVAQGRHICSMSLPTAVHSVGIPFLTMSLFLLPFSLRSVLWCAEAVQWGFSSSAGWITL